MLEHFEICKCLFPKCMLYGFKNTHEIEINISQHKKISYAGYETLNEELYCFYKQFTLLSGRNKENNSPFLGTVIFCRLHTCQK